MKQEIKNFFAEIIFLIKSLFSSVFGLICSCFSTKLSLWYTFWFVSGCVYLYYHWDSAMKFIPFNGYSLIFIVWLGLILKPFVKNLNSPWGNFGFNEAQAEQKDAKKEFEDKLNQVKNGGTND